MSRRKIVITDENLLERAKAWGPTIAIPPGEPNKTREMKAWVEDEMLKRGYGRDTLVIAFGGGVVSDLAGFVAATFCRGVPWIAVPTTLIALVDASIGGKVGVNTPLGKNLIGAFHPPQEVVCDFAHLDTLPEEEWKNGLAEVLKYGFIADPTILEAPRTEKSLLRCIEIKRKVILQDPKEQGLRRILNFGHTVGHALEKASGYTVKHGEAVATGMRVAARVSHKMGHLAQEELEKIERILDVHGFEEHELSPSLLNLLAQDKKSKGGKARFVLLEKIGKAMELEGAYCTTVDDALLEAVICT
ncbi:MAG: 3-dehydroquinate synthase [Chlamydiales bacterium]|nr:3-dehydroquinate synthase [Chlamydiales bacterium]